MTAQEARKLSDSVTSDAEQVELKRLEERIKFSAENGNRSIGESDSISAAVLAELKKRGFEVKDISDRDGRWTTISW